MAEIDTVSGTTHEVVEPLTNYLLGRVQKDYNEGKTILGGIVTSTNRDLDAKLGSLMHKSAYSGGFDLTHYFKDKNWRFDFNTAFSQVNGSKEALQITQKSSARYFQRPDNDYAGYDPDRTSLSGSGGKMQLQKLNGHLFLLGCILWRTPGFEINDLGYIQEADAIYSLIAAGYKEWDPKWIYRNYNFSANIWTAHNFGGQPVGTGLAWNGFMNLKNYWNIWTGVNLSSAQLSSGTLRGGPAMRIPGTLRFNGGFSGDHRKKLNFSIRANFSSGLEKNSRNFNTAMDITYKPANFLYLTLSPGYNPSFNELQYVTKLNSGGSDKYFFASIDRKTISSSFRVNINLSPDLTIQYWGQPFIATGKYYDHKMILNPTAGNFRDRFWTFTTAQKTFDEQNNQYRFDLNLDGTTDYVIGNNDFKVREFLSNLVVRWEYSPGSSVYLVWSQTRSSYENTGDLEFIDDVADLFNTADNHPHNVFLVKFSYRFGIK